MADEPEVLREVWRITARRGGAVYRTQYVEDRWVPMSEPRAGQPDGNPDLMWVAKSTNYEGPTIRRAES